MNFVKSRVLKEINGIYIIGDDALVMKSYMLKTTQKSLFIVASKRTVQRFFFFFRLNVLQSK